MRACALRWALPAFVLAATSAAKPPVEVPGRDQEAVRP